MNAFKQEFSFEQRLSESTRIKIKYPDRIPVIVQKEQKSDVPDIDKKKFLVPADLSLGQFVYIIRKRIQLEPEKAIFIFINDTLPPVANVMSQIYKDYADKDQFLYLSYTSEETFGNHFS